MYKSKGLTGLGIIFLLAMAAVIYIGFVHPKLTAKKVAVIVADGAEVSVETTEGVSVVVNVEGTGDKEVTVVVDDGWHLNPVTWGWNILVWGSGWLFWGLFLVFCIIECRMCIEDEFTGCTVVFIIAIFLSGAFAKLTFNPLVWFTQAEFWIKVGYYIGIGILWMCFKWDRKNEKRVLECREAKNRFRRENNISGSEIPSNLTEKFKQRVSRHYAEPLEYKDHMGDLAGWLFWWPFSLIMTFIGEILEDFVKWLIERCGFILNLITKFRQRAINKELNV